MPQHKPDSAADLDAMFRHAGSPLPPLRYLAQPYTAPDPETSAIRARAGLEAAAALIRKGMVIYAPIAVSGPLHEAGVRPPAGWYVYDLAILRRCQELLVLQLPGWEQSAGVSMEIAAAMAMDIPVTMLDPQWAGVEPATLLELQIRANPD